MWLLVVFFLFDPGQIRYRASVHLSSCYLHTTIYTPPQMKFLATPLIFMVLWQKEAVQDAMAAALISWLHCFACL